METRQGINWVAGESTPLKTWITRVLNFGTWEEWQEMKARVRPEQIQEALDYPLKGQWNKHGKAFAETVFDCQLPNDVLINYHV
jgi:hypothetical protein